LVQRRVTGWIVRESGFDSRNVNEISLFCTASRPALGPTQPPTQWVLWALSPTVKREADHSPPSSAAVMDGGTMLPFPSASSWRRA
jgi:hypothetical protein